MDRPQPAHKQTAPERSRSLLAETAMALIDFPPGEDLYAFIGERLCELAGVRYVIVTTFDPTNEKSTVRAIAGVGTRMQTVFNLLGQNPIGMVLPANPRAVAVVLNTGLLKLKEGLYELSFRALPRPVCQALEQAFNVGDMYVVGFAENDRLFGSATMIYQRGAKPDNIETLQTLMGLAAVAIKRHQTQEALDTSREAYRDLFEGVPVGLYQTTPDGRYLNINRACIEILGCPDRATLMARHPAEFYADPADRERWIARLEREGEIRNLEGHWRRYDGQPIRVLESTRVVRDADGNALYYEGSVQDITARKAMEQQLRRQEQLAALGRMAASIAHDFRTILSSILLYAQLTQLKPGLPLGAQQNLQTIINETARAADLVQQILDFTGRAMLDLQPVDLAAELRQGTAELRRTMPNTIEVTLNVAPDGAPYTIRADAGRVQQVLTNLMHNARDAMPEGGRIALILDRIVIPPGADRLDGPDAPTSPPPVLRDTVLDAADPTLASGTWARLRIQDTGPGIPTAIQPRLFEPFFTTKEVGHGVGMGLPQVYGIVRRHHGHITIASEPDAGTTVTIYLPLGAGKPEEKAP